MKKPIMASITSTNQQRHRTAIESQFDVFPKQNYVLHFNAFDTLL